MLTTVESGFGPDIELGFGTHKAGMHEEHELNGEIKTKKLICKMANKSTSLFLLAVSGIFFALFYTNISHTANQMDSNMMQPSFRIVEVEKSMTASTFKAQILHDIAHLKSPEDTLIKTDFFARSTWDKMIADERT